MEHADADNGQQEHQSGRKGRLDAIEIKEHPKADRKREKDQAKHPESGRIPARRAAAQKMKGGLSDEIQRDGKGDTPDGRQESHPTKQG